MAVVVVEPDPDRFSPLVLEVAGMGVETLIGHQSLVALDLPVVPVGVDPGALVPIDERVGRTAERFGGVAAAVVGYRTRDLRDAVGSEGYSCPVDEGDGRGGLLVLQRLGVGQAGEAVLDRVEVGIPDILLVFSLSGEGLGAAVSPPAAVGDLPDLRDVHVDHVTGIASHDLPSGAPVLLIGGM